MHIVSVNVGQPATVTWGGRTFETSIDKRPTADRLAVTKLNMVGDAQADLAVHGGIDKAVYAYDRAHYAFWQGQLPNRLGWANGLFGENLTTDGLPDETVRIGDVFRVGTVRLRAVQPRLPCFKLNARFDDRHMVKRFSNAVRCGIYFRVLEEGHVQAGDGIEQIEQAPDAITIRDVADWYLNRTADADALRRLYALPHLPNRLKNSFRRKRLV